MSLSGVEVPVETLNHIEPNTVLVVVSDENEQVRVVKIDPHSVPAGEAFLRVTADAADGGETQGGCWVRNNGGLVWKDPCPY